MLVRQIGLVLLILCLFIGRGIGAEENIHRIIILGNAKVEEGVIRGAIKSREGGPFSVEKIREDLRSIFDLGSFTDVQVDIKPTPQGNEVIFIVVEKPSIKDILIRGYKKLKLDDIKEKVTLTSRSILNLDKVKESSEQIRKLYFSKGYYGVKVEEKVDYLETNEVVVTFAISEGPKGHIQKIVFKGNKKIKSSELRKLMTTKRRNIISFITKTGTLDEDILKNDLQLLTAYYYDQGYLDAKLSEPKINLSNPKKIQIEVGIVEGPQYHLGNIDFKGDLLTTKEALFKGLKIKRGDVYSNSVIRKEVNGLTEKFANQGYAYIEVNPEIAVDSKNLVVQLTFEIEKKSRVSYEKIQVAGNTKTRDKVIRRELAMAEGERYNAADVNKSRYRLKRTGFFKEVDFTTSRGSTEDKINLDVKVEEAPTGAVTFGVGYSTIESLIGSAAVSDRNLFGLGYAASLKFNLGLKTQDAKFGFTDPHFLGYPYSAGIDLYHERVEIFDTYSYKITGGNLRFGKELTDLLRVDAMYKLETVDIYHVTDSATDYIKEQKGKRTTSAVSISPSIDNRDDYFNPRRGGRHSLFIQDAGGILGGDNSFVKGIAQSSWYFPLPLSFTLNLRAQAGMVWAYGGKTLPVYEKFYVGGISTVRGFEYGKAGTLDTNGEAIGSKNLVVFSADLIFPISREIGLMGALFFDVGKGFDRWKSKIWRAMDFTDPLNPKAVITKEGVGVFPLRLGAGPGIRWYSPFGPIHIDFGFNLNPKKGEKGHVIDFTAGTVY